MRIEINKENKAQYDLIYKSFESMTPVEVLGCSYVVVGVNRGWNPNDAYPYKITVDLLEVAGK